MKTTIELNKRFTKDYKLPIRLFDEPYFSYQLYLFDKYYNCKAKYELFKKVLSTFPTEKEYDNYYKTIKESMMYYIIYSKGFNNFSNEYLLPKEVNFIQRDIYKETFIGKRFLSIDMIKANFNSLKYYDPSIFDYKDTWEDFVRKFTDNEHIIQSKYIREVILGKCNPSQQTVYERILMHDLVSKSCTDNVVYFNNDEVVFDITNLSEDKVNSLINTFKTNAVVPVRIELFNLKAIYKDNKIISYIKQFDDGTVDFKKYDNRYISCIIKLLENKPITNEDLVYEKDGEICKITEIPNLTIK